MAKNKIRETTHEDLRKATSLSKQSILLIHQRRLPDAEKMVGNAKELITNLQKQAEDCPDIVSGGMLSAAQQEYAEANILLTLVKRGQIRNTPRDQSALNRLCTGISRRNRGVPASCA